MFHPKGPSFVELAKQCLSSTERGYDLLAPKFDYTPFRTPEPAEGMSFFEGDSAGARKCGRFVRAGVEVVC